MFVTSLVDYTPRKKNDESAIDIFVDNIKPEEITEERMSVRTRILVLKLSKVYNIPIHLVAAVKPHSVSTKGRNEGGFPAVALIGAPFGKLEKLLIHYVALSPVQILTHPFFKIFLILFLRQYTYVRLRGVDCFR